MSKDMKTNPKYIVRQLSMPLAAVIGLSVAVPAGMSLSDKFEESVVYPDRTGSAMEASIIAEHKADFAKLEQMKAEIELLESQTVLTDGSAELTQMKSDFNRLAVSTYNDLYLDGSTKENGAGISEQAFQELHTQFSDNVINPAMIGFAEKVDAGMLDETLAASDLKTGSEVERFQTVKSLNQTLSEHHKAAVDKQEENGMLSFMGGAVLFMVFMFAGATVSDRYRREPRRIPANRPKTPYGKH